MVKTGKAKKVN